MTPSVQRLTNLAFALLGAGQVRTPDWIRRHVEGYPPGQSQEAFRRMLSRDVQTLRRAGVPVIQTDGYGIVEDDYELPEVSFTPEEATVLGLAGEMGQAGELGLFGRSGWTKIAAAGADRDVSEAPVYTAETDLNRIPAATLTAVLTCVRAQKRMRFDYQAAPTTARIRRTMDPWGVVVLNSRVYVVGWDVERQNPRSFRMLRISDVKASHDPPTHTHATAPLQEIVAAGLKQGRDYVDAVVRVPHGMAKELVDAGERAGELVRMSQVDQDWLVRTAAGYAPEVEVREPADVRALIVDLLKESL